MGRGPLRSARRFDLAALVAGLLFGGVSALYFATGFGGGSMRIPFPWLVAGLLIGLGVVGIVRTMSRRR